MNELTITQGSLVFDFETAKAKLLEQIEPYNNVVFTEDTKKDAKECVANLRRERKAYEDDFKKAKADYMKPFDAFWNESREFLSLYDAPIANISGQIEAFEQQRKEEKREHIAGLYREIMGDDADLAKFLPLATIYDSKWENATASDKKIKEAIMEKKLGAKTAIETIKAMHSDKEEDALSLYRQTFDIAQSIQLINNYEQQKAEILKGQEEKARQAEVERIRAEERAKLEAEAQKQAEIAAAIEQAQADTIEAFIPDQTPDAEPIAHAVIIQATDAEWDSLTKYMDSIGIGYEDMPF